MSTDSLADLLSDEEKDPQAGASSGGEPTLDALLDDSNEDDQPEAEWLWREPETTIQLPFAWKVGEQVTREVKLSPMDGLSDDLLLDESGGRKERHERMERVLSLCTVSIGDKRRPSDKTAKQLPDFFMDDLKTSPLPNRIMTLIRLRQLSVHDEAKGISGHKFVFQMTCPHCRKLNPRLSVRLDNLRVTSLGDEFCREDVHVYRNKEHTIEWRVPQSKDEPKIARIVKETKEAMLSGIFAVSILTINGKKPGRLSDIQDLPKTVRNGLQSEIECGGIDTQVVNECGMCRKEFMSELPWGQKGFFFPSVSGS